MNKQEIQEIIKDTAYMVSNATKQENSNLYSSLQKDIKDLSGNLNTLTTEFRDHRAKDEAWKKEADPYIQGWMSLSTSAKIVVWLSLGISAIIGAFFGIKELFKK